MNPKTTWNAVKTALMEQFDPVVPSELGEPIARFPILIFIAACFCFFVNRVWNWYSSNVSAVAPMATFIGAAAVAWAALAQATTARRRHEEQTRADIQRRITESFSKAAEQLGSDKLPVRLGGIYTLERISRESWTDYWPAMETLTAFVRESGCQTVHQSDATITTDVAAVMIVLTRRSIEAKIYEVKNRLRFNLSNADLRGATLHGLDLPVASFVRAGLRGAKVIMCNFDDCNFLDADLSRSRILQTSFKDARLSLANLKEATLSNSNLSGCYCEDADFTKATFSGTSLENASLSGQS